MALTIIRNSVMKQCYECEGAYAFFPAQMLTVLPFGWLFYLHGTLTVETFVTVIILSLGMSAPIVAAFNFVDTLAQVDEILKAEERVHGNTPVTFAGHDIEVKNVSFGYHADKEILHCVSLSIPQNSMTALVGPSGSGKTTLAKLIAGFWDVKSGTITMGGHDLKDIPLTELYDQVAFVSQDNYLSGGERQRIAIARAMLKDAPIIVLDEATAYIDPENEDRLQKAIEALTRNKTILKIAHRLKTVRSADQILVLDGGKIVQHGRHEELIRQPGIYADFVGGKKETASWKL